MPQNLNRAVRLFKKSAGQNNRKAERELALLYARGCGVKKDPTKALYWQRKAEKRKQISAATQPS
ncbi:MAG: hypothetical protein ACP5QA_13110 [Phycisphaerae bacterium]